MSFLSHPRHSSIDTAETPVVEPPRRPNADEARHLVKVISRLWSVCGRKSELLEGAISPLGAQTVTGLIMELLNDNVKLWTPWGEINLAPITALPDEDKAALHTIEQQSSCRPPRLSRTAHALGATLTNWCHGGAWQHDRVTGPTWEITTTTRAALPLPNNHLDFKVAKTEWSNLIKA